VIEPRGIEFANYVVDMGMKEVGALLWWGSLKEGGHGEHMDVDGIKRLKLIFEKYYGRLWNGFIRPRVGTSGRLFKMRRRNLWLYIKGRISRLTKNDYFSTTNLCLFK